MDAPPPFSVKFEVIERPIQIKEEEEEEEVEEEEVVVEGVGAAEADKMAKDETRRLRQRDRARMMRATETDEQRSRRKERQREYARQVRVQPREGRRQQCPPSWSSSFQVRASLPQDELVRRRLEERDRRRLQRAMMTEEEKEAIRTRQREYAR